MALKVNPTKTIDNPNPQLEKLGGDDGALNLVIDGLPVTDVLSLLSTCKQYTPLRKDDQLWKQLLIRDFGPESIPQDVSCETAYKKNHDIVKDILGIKGEVPVVPGTKFCHLFQILKKPQPSGLIELCTMCFLEDPDNRKEAERQISLIKNAEREKSYFLRHIADSYKKAGNLIEERRFLSEAERVAMLISDLFERSQALNRIGWSYWEAGKLDEAARLFSEAERVAMLIAGPLKKNKALNDIARGLRVVHNLAESERVAMLISGPEKSTLLENVSWAHGRNLAEAERVAMLIPDPSEKSKALRNIAESHAWHGNLAEAERVAMLIPDPEKKSKALGYLGYIAVFHANHGNLAEAERGAMLISDPSEKSNAFRYIAYGYREAGNLAEAERVAMLIPDPEKKSTTLRAIVDSHREAGNFGEAKRVAMLIPDPQLRNHHLRDLTLCRRFVRCIKSVATRNLLNSLAVVGVATIVAYRAFFGQREE
jgi:hypothetical protein